MRLRIVFAGACALASLACSGEKAAVLVTPPGVSGSSTAPSGSPAASAQGAATVSIEQPADRATVPAGDLNIKVTVGGFTLKPAAGSAPTAGEGHLIFYMDVDFVPTQPGTAAFTSPGTYQVSDLPQLSWPGVQEGRHALFVQLVNHDDSPLSPPVTDRAVVTVTSASPGTTPPAA